MSEFKFMLEYIRSHLISMLPTCRWLNKAAELFEPLYE